MNDIINFSKIDSKILNQIKELHFNNDFISFVDFINLKENQVYDFTLQNISFGNLSLDKLYKIYKDGRAFSHLIEPWIECNCPILQHIEGCKDHDFVNRLDNTIKYEAKTWTSNSGLNFQPSNMIGKGRRIDTNKFHDKCNQLIYIIISNINFPRIKIKFIKGNELLKIYPKGSSGKSKKEYNNFFGKKLLSD